MQTRRIIMTVHRGPMDATAVIVYPWEKPLLEEIHPGGANEKTITELCNLHNPVSVKRQKLPYGAEANKEYAPDMREQLELMCRVDPEDDPTRDPEGEFSRLAAKYGMHPEVKMLTVEKVYGSPVHFRRMLRDFAKAKNAEEAWDLIPSRHEPLVGKEEAQADAAAPAPKSARPPLAELDRNELLALCKEEGVPIPKNARADVLRDLLTEALV